MPVISSSYKPSWYFRSGHWATIYAGLFRRVNDVEQHRERVELWDGDFLDLDISYAQQQGAAKEIAILLHGLEGHGQRPYITGMARQMNRHGIDACAVNFRGCSGEPNRLFRSYHSGATEDLEAVIRYLLGKDQYKKIYLIGFSLGANLALKYLGEGRDISKEVKAAVAISTPCDLHDTLKCLMSFENVAYNRRFKNHLVDKLWNKQVLYPEELPSEMIDSIKTLQDFDDYYTAPAHGFKDSIDYYTQSSCKQFLTNITHPVYMLSAKDDSFLGEPCYPYAEAEANKFIQLEVSTYGGHCGFPSRGEIAYKEERALKFLQALL